MIRCIAVDDEPMALEKLVDYIGKVPYLELVASCSDAFEAMKVLAENDVDAVFMDINMPDVNGLEFVKSLSVPPFIVFITAYEEYAVDSYKVRAVDYVLKPYGFEEFQRAASNLLHQWEMENGVSSGEMHAESGVLYLKVDYRYVRVEIDDIVYIEGMNEYLKVRTSSSEPFLTHTTFRKMNERLPEYFVQVHRPYVVNMKHVKEVERSIILMDDGTHITVSDSGKETLMNYLRKYGIRR